jgi:hypothetical protein
MGKPLGKNLLGKPRRCDDDVKMDPTEISF